MRVGQKNKLTYRWARKGSRPRATHDQRTESTYLFGAVCPERGTGAALVLPTCNSQAMQLHLDEITRPGCARHRVARSSRLAWHQNAENPEQYLADAATTAIPRAQRSGKHLAIHETKLALQSGLQMLRRHRRSLLLCLEHPDRSAVDFQKRVVEITSGNRVPVVYDSVGKDTFMKSLDCLAPLGLLAFFGQSSGPVEPLNLALLAQKGSLFVTRPTLQTYGAEREAMVAMAKELFDVVQSGVVKININQTYPLKDVSKAHRDLEARKTTGSTV
jgi:hypothetical protein